MAYIFNIAYYRANGDLNYIFANSAMLICVILTNKYSHTKNANRLDDKADTRIVLLRVGIVHDRDFDGCNPNRTHRCGCLCNRTVPGAST